MTRFLFSAILCNILHFMRTGEKMSKEKRITVSVDDDLHKQAKIEAAKQGKTISEIIRDLLSTWLKREAEQQSASQAK